ncbi:MAG: choice-of-anchor D domain-containing protein, partial [Promethearchaeota archaeon]
MRAFKTLKELFAISIFFILSGCNFLFSESGIYDRIGIIPEHGSHGAVPEENIDLFTGNLTLRFLDIYLPGPNGFDLKIWRVYNSKIVRDRFPGGAWGIQQEPYSWVGMGWTMHMGRVHNFDSNMPIIEFPDGRWETAYLRTGGTTYVTREFLKYDKDNYKLYFKDGTVWTFGEQKTITYVGSSEQVRVVTEIENSYGHKINIYYHSGSIPTITKITDSMGREVNFETSGTTNPKLTRIYVKDAHGNTSNYYYTVETFSGGYYQLTEYDPPELPSSTYNYNSGPYYEMSTVNTSYGGEMKYEYVNHTFYFYTQPLDTRVINKKEIKFYPSSSYKTWNYSYPSYQNTTTGTVTVDGPDFGTQVTYYAYDSDHRWKIGLLKNKSFNDGSYSEEHEWLSQVISSTRWYVLGVDMGAATAPLISSFIKTRDGDAENEDKYIYQRALNLYGLPTKVEYYANGSLKSYKTLTYYFEGNSIFESKYMLSYIEEEKHYTSGGSKLKSTLIDYYTTSGKCGAIDKITRYRLGTTHLIWDYTYTSSNPNLITITVNLPGSAGTETYEYRYGILSKIERPGYTEPELSRTISNNDSSILSETNQHGGTMSFQYDGLGRIKKVVMPSPFNDINATWSTNSVSITQGGNAVTKYWDGMGRDTGHEETGDGITLYYLRTLDSEGRVIEESKGSTASSDKYIYELSASGQVKKITDPRGKITNISYSGNKKTVTDPNNKITEFEYNNLPGLVTKLKDPQSRFTYNTYDAIGRLKQVYYNSSRNQYFYYDGLDNLTKEIHPETGTIDYTYNSENNLWKKDWGGASITYSYNTSNQLTTINSDDETITYLYDSKGRVNKISSDKGWYRDNILYNYLGAVTQERQYIPGLGAKTLTYAYDNNNNLISISYSDGRTVTYTNNSLNMPETANFNGKSLIDQISYGINKQPTSMNINGNGTEFNAAYNSSGFMSSASLKKGANMLYGSSYGYDNVGNITSISNTTPNLSASFSYDSLNRLTSAIYTPSGVGRVDNFSYTYDEYGNMKTVKENGNTIFSKTYTNKNRINGYVYDARGNLTSDSDYQYVWDNQNRLQEVKTSGGTSLGNYIYDERGLRLKVTKEPLPPPLPEINIKQGTTNIPDGGSFNFGTHNVGTNTDKTFTIQNTGTANLTLSGSPIIQITGTNADQFSVQQQPSSPVTAGNTTSFIIRFSPTSEEGKTASISIVNNDSDENPYDITLAGTGYAPQPEMNIKQGTTNIPDGGNFHFHEHLIWSHTLKTFTIENTGEGDLILSGSPIIQITGQNANQFGVQQQPTSPVAPGNTTTFILRFSPTYVGYMTAKISIANNDSNENPYDINIYGQSYVEEEPPEPPPLPQSFNPESDPSGNIDENASQISEGPLNVTFPNDGEQLRSGSRQNITWKSDDSIREVKIEYSTDNGSTYQTIVERTPNTGVYRWQVPQDISPSCLIRISDADGYLSIPEKLNFEFKFKISRILNAFQWSPDFTVSFGAPDVNTKCYKFADISFISDEMNGREDIMFNYIPGEPQNLEFFLEGWHHIRVEFDMNNYSGSVWLEGQLIFENVPLETDMNIKSLPEISMSSSKNAPVKIWVEDLRVEMKDLNRMSEDENSGELIFMEPIVIDNFEIYPSGKFPQQGGWSVDQKTIMGEKIKEKYVDMDDQSRRFSIQDEEVLAYVIDDKESISGIQSFKLETPEGNIPRVIKKIALPERYPFDITDGNFAIADKRFDGYKDRQGFDSRQRESNRKKGVREQEDDGSIREQVLGAYETLHEILESNQISDVNVEKQSNPENQSPIRVLSGSPENTYYIYSFDGKLLAEYDTNGACVRDYIYIGNRLIAEYRPQETKYYYYASDQVNSIRMITDDSGTKVYSTAYDPYGGIQKTWENTYDPKLKFSGKERDNDSGLDYFGARYYGHSSYRFISTDPVINREEAISNPQLWNLYSYCRNNPVTFVDPTGMDDINIFFGFRAGEEAKIFGREVDFPNFKDLSSLAEAAGHTLKVINEFKSEDFVNSLWGKDTWSFFIGHSALDPRTTEAMGISFIDGYLATHTIVSPNKFVGIFACDSADYAFSLITGPIVFAVDSRGDGSSAHGLA